jgi:hypothetical protein
MAHALVHLGRSEDDRRNRAFPGPMEATPEYPSECCFCLTEELLEKMGLPHDIEEGDVIDLRIIAKVTSTAHHLINGEYSARVEFQPIIAGAESETDESIKLEEI